ncbi:Transcription elongation regulator 1-like protein [Acipenser ruthenus]|uniref:Transcription elongation regulator 1-like protein n=1 Tax=Acipenser ruthenus TaxID=7906 RepID=A0A444UJZ6_ACIRT|nr:Transcription elongation regulator 1-like protein [Acipenser ruthenus]
MIPILRLKGQPQLWQMNGEPPPWIWRIPAASRLYRIGGAPTPFLVSSHHPPPLLQAVAGWQLPCDPFLPLMPMPSAPEAAVHQFPVPNVQVYLNNSLAMDTTWIHPEEVRLFQRHEKPLLITNQVAMSRSRPATASTNLHTLLVTPQSLSGGCPVAIKQVGSNKRFALAAAAAATAAMVAVESEASQGPSSASTQPYHVLTLSPIKIPLLSTPVSAASSRMDGQLPAQVARVTAVSAPAVSFMASDWKDQTPADKSIEANTTLCTGTLILHTDRQTKSTESKNEVGEISTYSKVVVRWHGGLAEGCEAVQPLSPERVKLILEDSSKMTIEEEITPKDNRPVASTPVPGSQWCVVWTGDDRVFFFNPTMQLSVWDKPIDLKSRGDLNRIIEDPPHKRKKEASPTDKSSNYHTEDINEEHTTKTKRNKTEEPVEDTEEKPFKVSPHRTILPLEVRTGHFRDMLLERGVSAFSTWEKELHKIVFDPRYLLLNSEERKQVFEQFVKARIKEEYKEKKRELQQAKEEFRTLLEESKITSRSTFKEFAEKYGRDQRFKKVQKKKDQEHFFNQFINSLKKRDKENRLRLRKMR